MKSIGKMLVRPFGSGKIERPLPGKPEGTSGVASLTGAWRSEVLVTHGECAGAEGHRSDEFERTATGPPQHAQMAGASEASSCVLSWAEVGA